jgi:antitoxin CcdA
MAQVYDQSAQKKPTNVSINSDLLAKARKLNINLSATLENSLSEQVRVAAREDWLEENKAVLEATNEFVAKNGLFADSYKIL